MPRANARGGKHHKKGKKRRDDDNQNHSTALHATNNQIYASVQKKLGGSRLLVECSDGKNRSAIIPGRFFKRVWINEGDILLCELSIGSEDGCHILHKYSNRDANVLKSQGKIQFDIVEEKDESGYKFVDDDSKIVFGKGDNPASDSSDSSESSNEKDIPKTDSSKSSEGGSSDEIPDLNEL